jgi:hypothetical protein
MFSPGLAFLAGVAVFAMGSLVVLIRNRCVTERFYCNAAVISGASSMTEVN